MGKPVRTKGAVASVGLTRQVNGVTMVHAAGRFSLCPPPARAEAHRGFDGARRLLFRTLRVVPIVAVSDAAEGAT